MHIVSVNEDGTVGDTVVRVLYTDDNREREFRCTLTGARAAAVLNAEGRNARMAAIVAGIEAELAEAATIKIPTEEAANILSEAKAQASLISAGLDRREKACVEAESRAENAVAIAAARTVEVQQLEMQLVALRAEASAAEELTERARAAASQLAAAVALAEAQVNERAAADRRVEKDAELAAIVARVKSEVLDQFAGNAATAT